MDNNETIISIVETFNVYKFNSRTYHPDGSSRIARPTSARENQFSVELDQ